MSEMSKVEAPQISGPTAIAASSQNRQPHSGQLLAAPAPRPQVTDRCRQPDAQRQIYLARRAKAARWRLLISVALLLGSASMWGLYYFDFLAWYWALIPTGLLVTVLALGTIAARAGREADRKYHSSQTELENNSQRKAIGIEPANQSLSASQNVTGNQVAIAKTIPSAPLVIPRQTPEVVALSQPTIAPMPVLTVEQPSKYAQPIPAKTSESNTEVIPGAEQAKIVAQHLISDEPETRWSLGTPAAEPAPLLVVADAPAETSTIVDAVSAVAPANLTSVGPAADLREMQEAVGQEYATATEIPMDAQEPEVSTDSGPNAMVLEFPAPPDRPTTDTLGLPLDEILARRRAVS